MSDTLRRLFFRTTVLLVAEQTSDRGLLGQTHSYLHVFHFFVGVRFCDVEVHLPQGGHIVQRGVNKFPGQELVSNERGKPLWAQQSPTIVFDAERGGNILALDALQQVFEPYQIPATVKIENKKQSNILVPRLACQVVNQNANLHTPLLSASLICSERWYSRALLIAVYQFMTSVIELSSGSVRTLSLWWRWGRYKTSNMQANPWKDYKIYILITLQAHNDTPPPPSNSYPHHFYLHNGRGRGPVNVVNLSNLGIYLNSLRRLWNSLRFSKTP